MVSGREVGFRVMFLGGNVFFGFAKIRISTQSFCAEVLKI